MWCPSLKRPFQAMIIKLKSVSNTRAVHQSQGSDPSINCTLWWMRSDQTSCQSPLRPISALKREDWKTRWHQKTLNLSTTTWVTTIPAKHRRLSAKNHLCRNQEGTSQETQISKRFGSSCKWIKSWQVKTLWMLKAETAHRVWSLRDQPQAKWMLEPSTCVNQNLVGRCQVATSQKLSTRSPRAREQEISSSWASQLTGKKVVANARPLTETIQICLKLLWDLQIRIRTMRTLKVTNLDRESQEFSRS